MLRNNTFFMFISFLMVLSTAASRVDAQVLEEGFDQADGPVENWTTHSGIWEVVDEMLVGSSGGGETWSWAGSPPMEFPSTYELTFEMEFPNTMFLQNPDVGRHGGVMFCADSPTMREDANNNGYDLHWIDRESDRGLRLLRYTAPRETFPGPP